MAFLSKTKNSSIFSWNNQGLYRKQWLRTCGFNPCCPLFFRALISLMAERLFGRNNVDVSKLSDDILEMLFYGIQHLAVQV